MFQPHDAQEHHPHHHLRLVDPRQQEVPGTSWKLEAFAHASNRSVAPSDACAQKVSMKCVYMQELDLGLGLTLLRWHGRGRHLFLLSWMQHEILFQHVTS